MIHWKNFAWLLAAVACDEGISSPMARSADPAAGRNSGVAVVELFTSQGCSSCPPADRLLADLAARSEKDHLPVFCLSFHVDYWNKLGWADPYSDASFTERQRGYAAATGSDQIYTPQMIVNGGRAFVGSERDEAKAAIQAALHTPATSTVKLFASESSQGSIQILYEVVPHAPGRLLQVAVVQRTLSNEVTRGENAGTTSTHSDVVRAFRSIPLDAADNGGLTIDLPEGIAASSCAVVALVQSDGMAVKGAVSFSLAADALNRVERSLEEWRQLLAKEQFEVMRQRGTERPFTGALLKPHGEGIYTCVGCGAPLFDSATKFESGTGWPSFWKPNVAGQVATHSDVSLGTSRIEVTCRRCDSHLGHVFDDGPQPTGLRYCINSAALSFVQESTEPSSRPTPPR